MWAISHAFSETVRTLNFMFKVTWQLCPTDSNQVKKIMPLYKATLLCSLLYMEKKVIIEASHSL